MFTSHNAAAAESLRLNQAMGPGQEFDVIRRLMHTWGDLATDIGDDAAVLPSRADGLRVVSTDACVEHVHFRSAWIAPDEVGHRAAAAALSDLAAMGADAEFVLVAFVVPDQWQSQLEAVAQGIGRVVRAAGARIVGGNLSRGDTFGITLTVIGCAARPVSRSGARPGDLVLATGLLGGPGQALTAWLNGQSPTDWARERFAQPWPRLAQGQRLAAHGATAMLDLSDGLAADLGHLAAASSVRVLLDADRVPCGPGCGVPEALNSGEEYELVATIPPTAWPALQEAWDLAELGPLRAIGRIEALDPADVPSVVTADTGADGGGDRTTAGFDHFAPRVVEMRPGKGEL